MGKKYFLFDDLCLPGHNHLEINFQFQNTEYNLYLEINFQFRNTDLILKSILNYRKIKIGTANRNSDLFLLNAHIEARITGRFADVRKRLQ